MRTSRFLPRLTTEPDPVWAAALAALGGADAITVHLREDRRHIQDPYLEVLRSTEQVPLNLEAAIAPEMIGIACRVRPDQVTLVPERREEVTTEGGLDILAHATATAEAVRRLHEAGVRVSLFLDPSPRQIDAAVGLGVAAVELHTGSYASAASESDRAKRLGELARAGTMVRQAGMALHAGHGLTYRNVVPVARIDRMGELNIGHSIVSRAVLVGFTQAVREMKALIVGGPTVADASV
ncbi:MAG: pyridoxine 5'-phosphate synthase [Planctomycetia bacterium]